MRFSVGLLSLATMPLLGCFNATDTVSGEDALIADPCQPGGPNTGNRWQDLYACYFGPSGQASCASLAGCHSRKDQPGAMYSGYVCGSTPDACWHGMTASIVPMGGAPNSTQTILYGALRKTPINDIASNNMPKGSTFVFQPSDLARISDWIEHGAPEN